MVTVNYERHIGRRVTGQQGDGSFGASATKTVPGDPADVAAAWAAWAPENFPLAIDGAPRESVTPKWRYWRVDTADGCALSVNINSRASGKTTLAVEMKKLHSVEQVAEYKAAFKECLARFADSLR